MPLCAHGRGCLPGLMSVDHPAGVWVLRTLRCAGVAAVVSVKRSEKGCGGQEEAWSPYSWRLSLGIDLEFEDASLVAVGLSRATGCSGSTGTCDTGALPVRSPGPRPEAARGARPVAPVAPPEPPGALIDTMSPT